MPGLGKKRTFRELERWDIEDDGQHDFSKSVMDIDENHIQSEEESSTGHESVNTLKFNRGLLCKASAAVDLIS